MTQDTASARHGSMRARHDDEAEELVDYCGRPTCRNEFRRRIAPGRRQAYCSEICRRTAERELRQARSRLAHFEGLVVQLRIDVAAFGRPTAEDGDETSENVVEAQRKAEDAVVRAGGVLDFASDSDDVWAREFRKLYTAVVPVLGR